jgi:NADPH:quinone reductase-like Zn-dependent oxidoreductase
MPRPGPAATRRSRKHLFWWGAAALPLALFAAALIAYFTSTNACPEPTASPSNPMKAIVYCDYGSPAVLQLRSVQKPVPADNEILVKVRAAAVNPLDWHYMEGTPYLMRLGSGLRKPKVTRLGVDFAGTVEAAGKNVNRFRPGDSVFGGRTGAFAEYLTVRQDRAVVLKPANLTFEQAAAVPIAATAALQALRDQARVQPGERVLINGASGGVGTFAVQIARSYAAHVTGVCSASNADMVRSLGADETIDYTRQDFTRGGRQYDVIIDNVGNRPLSEVRRVLAPTGRYVQIGGGGPTDGLWFGPLPRVVGTLVLSRFVSQQMGMFLAELQQTDLTVLSDLMQAGKVTPAIDRRYPFPQAAEAVRYVEAGHARAKVVVTME